MCDTFCVRRPGGMLFAKNSDRPPGENQVVESVPARSAGTVLRTQYLSLPDTGAHALVGSRPTWLWGLEHGVNEHGVAIGNERIWTVDDPRACAPALIGMDLVRLALERSRSADDALETLTTLLEQHGQGGSGEAGTDEPYFSGFLLVDARGGWIVETSARTWAARPLGAGAAISNRITLSTDWTRASADVPSSADFDTWRNPRAPTAIADHRLLATRACVAGAAAVGARDVVATLRHHGEAPWGAPGSGSAVSPVPADVYDDFSGVTVCMHVRDYQATTASMVADLHDDGRQRIWVALGSPCASVYVPAFPPAVPAALASPSQWERFATLARRVERDADALAEIRAVLDPIEAELWDEADALWGAGDTAGARDFVERAYGPVDAALHQLGT